MCLRKLSEAVYSHNSFHPSSRVGIRLSPNRADSVAHRKKKWTVPTGSESSINACKLTVERRGTEEASAEAARPAGACRLSRTGRTPRGVSDVWQTLGLETRV